MTIAMPIRRIRRKPAPFQVIAAELVRQVRAGLYVPGEALPPRRALAESFGVTINTIGKAIDELIKQGLVNATERHGTFVARDIGVSAPAQAPSQVTPATHLVHVAGMVAMLVSMEADHTAAQRMQASLNEDRWANAVLRGLESGLADAGVQSRLYRVWPGGPYPDFAAALTAAERDGAGRLAVINAYNLPWIVEPMLRLVDPRRMPVICVAGVAIEANFPQVCYDQRQAGYLAARHAAEAGYERIVFAKLAEAEWISLRSAGAQRAIAQMARRGTAFAEFMLPAGAVGNATDIQKLSFPALQVLVTDWFDAACSSGGLRCDSSSAVILPSDRMAAALLAVLRERGIRPGLDLGVIGFDDGVGACEIGLSSVRPPLEQMGVYAARHLLANSEIAQHTLLSQVVPRNSTWRGAPGPAT